MGDDPTPVAFAVRPGTRAAVVAEDLQRAGLVRSALRFRQLAEASGLASQLKAGRHELRRTMSAPEILEALASGHSRRPELITIPEGLRAEEVALYLQERGVADTRSFLDIVAGRERQLPLPPGAASLEGYLFPDSYEFPLDPTPVAVVQTLLGQFAQRVDEPLRSQAAARGLSLHQLVTLASIIEREAVHASERPRIATVYYNRLALGMPLEADPTVQYALTPFGALTPSQGFWKPALQPADLFVDSPYNTYRVAGLPPGPICSPGLAALRAAADPEAGPWLYFVARGDGSHLFATSLEEHLRNIAAAQRPS